MDVKAKQGADWVAVAYKKQIFSKYVKVLLKCVETCKHFEYKHMG